MEKIDKNNPLVRYAIWEVYKHKSCYSDNLLEFKDMEIDHIIPKSYKNKKDKFEKIIKDCGLEDNFELDSLFNLVSISKNENRRKSDTEFSLAATLYFLEIARKNAPLIEKAIEKLKRLRNFDKNSSMLKSYIDEERDKEKRQRIVERIFSFISNEENDFDEVEKLYELDNEVVYKRYVNRIGLEAILPKYNNPETSCVIYFRTIKVRDCMILLDNKTILTELFSGLHTDPNYGARRFITFEQPSANSQRFVNLEDSYIHLGNNKLKLSIEDIHKFCKVIDDYADKYIEHIKNIENILKTHKYPLSKRRNNYKLLTLTTVQWLKLVDFAFNHDVDSGDTEWNIFDSNRFYIKVYTNKKHNKYDIGFHAFFNPELDEDIVLYPHSAVGDICITWELVEDLQEENLNKINERESWNAQVAYNWLVDEFIPKVLGRKKSKINNLNKRRHEIDNLIRNCNFKYIEYLKDKKVNSIKDLLEIANALQLFYYHHPRNRYYINKETFCGIYSSILMCINKSGKVDIHYICEKLNLRQYKTKCNLVTAIEQTINNLKDKTVDGFYIDYIFRALIAVLESYKINLSAEDFKVLKKNIDYFILLHDQEVMLEKYAINFI